MKALINYKIGIVFDSKEFAPKFHNETPEQTCEDFFSIECQIILLSPFECGIVTPHCTQRSPYAIFLILSFRNP